MQQERTKQHFLSEKTRLAVAKLIAAKLRSRINEKKTFDFTGLHLKVKGQTRNNLIPKMINQGIASCTVKTKGVLNDPNPTNIEDVMLLTKHKALLNQTHLKDEIQFNQDRSLAKSIQLSSGAKYTYQGKILQGEKHVQRSVYQLKMVLGQGSKISKAQYQKIKARNRSYLTLKEPFIDLKSPHERNLLSLALPILSKAKQRQTIERIQVSNEEHWAKLVQTTLEQDRTCSSIRKSEKINIP